MTYDVNFSREFARRADDKALGKIKLTGTIDLALNGKKLPDRSIEHLLNYMSQSWQDSYAGASDFADAQAKWTERNTKIADGTVGAGSGVSSWQTMARRLWRPVYLAVIESKDKKAHAAYKSGDSETRNKMVDESIEKNKVRVEKMVKAEIDRIKSLHETEINV